MKKLKNGLLLAGVLAALSFGAANVNAQGNFDPAEMRQRILERAREQLEVKSDDEWKIISERVEKVMTARRDAAGLGGMAAMFGRGGGGGGGGERRREAGNGGGGAGAAAGGGERGNREGGERRRGGGF